MFIPLKLLAFCKIFTLSLYLSRLHIIVRGFIPLFILFCRLDLRCVRAISIVHYEPSFSWITCCSFSWPMSPQEFLEYHLLSRYFSLTYPLDILASARHIPDQSDSRISLQFSVRYLLIYFQHCLLFLLLGSLWVLWFFSNLIALF